MIVTTRAGNRAVELRGATWPPLPNWVEFQGRMSQAGVPVTFDKALGLPNAGAAIKFIAETVGSLPLCVYEGYDADKVKARESWQWRLLYDQPNPECSAFDFRSDIAASVESCGNAFVRKLKAPRMNGEREILALYHLDPAEVVVKREGRGKIFKVGKPGYPDERETLTSAQVIHVRGFAPKGGDVGITPIAQYANAIGKALAEQEYAGRFYANDATPSSYLTVPGRQTRQQARELLATWNSTHGGSSNAGKLGVLFDGAELKTPGVPLRESQFIEGMEFSAEQIARIYLGPAASLLGSDANMKTEEDSLRFLNFALMPRLKRIEDALRADPDLFPDEYGLYPEFHTDEFLRADAGTQAEVLHKEIQSGLTLIDEARAEKGRPPLPDGMGQIPQITPVGGAPNPELVEAMRAALFSMFDQRALNPPPPEE